MSNEKLSLGMATRLSRYLQVLSQTKKAGRKTISSQSLSDYANVNPTQIRRDLSAFGRFGKRGVGYDVDMLMSHIREILKTSGKHNIALVGYGNLGRAIAASDIFTEHGFGIDAILDIDPSKVGLEAGGIRVRHIDDLGEVVRDHDIIVGVLAVPADAAQDAADSLIKTGVRIVFNYSDALIEAGPGVTVHSMSPAGELLYALYYYLS